MLKKILLCSIFALSVLSATPAVQAADMGAFIGLTASLDGRNDIGITFQATSTEKQNRFIVAAGLSYFPFSKNAKIGTPIGIGYQSVNNAFITSYDANRDVYEVSYGYVKTKKDEPKPVEQKDDNLPPVYYYPPLL